MSYKINGTEVIGDTENASFADLTVAGATTFNGNTTLGDTSADAISFTGSLASDLIPKTTSLYYLGSSTLRFKDVYSDNLIGSRILAGDGNAATPSISFENYTSSGIFADSVSQIGVSLLGTNVHRYQGERVYFTENGIFDITTAFTYQTLGSITFTAKSPSVFIASSCLFGLAGGNVTYGYHFIDCNSTNSQVSITNVQNTVVAAAYQMTVTTLTLNNLTVGSSYTARCRVTKNSATALPARSQLVVYQ